MGVSAESCAGIPSLNPERHKIIPAFSGTLVENVTCERGRSLGFRRGALWDVWWGMGDGEAYGSAQVERDVGRKRHLEEVLKG